MPVSINIAHLEKYVESPMELVDRSHHNLNCANFKDLPEEDDYADRNS